VHAAAIVACSDRDEAGEPLEDSLHEDARPMPMARRRHAAKHIRCQSRRIRAPPVSPSSSSALEPRGRGARARPAI
jgi:hypothetical protein